MKAAQVVAQANKRYQMILKMRKTMTQEEVAAKLGVTRQRITQLERKARKRADLAEREGWV